MIKKLFSAVGEYKRDSLLAPLFVTFEVILEVVIPFYMAKIIDKGINAADMNYIVRTGILLAVFALTSLMCGALSGKFAASASAGLAKNLRQKMYYNIQDFSFSNIDKFSSASLVTRLTTDITNVQNAYQMIIRGAVRSPVMLVSALVAAFKINSRLSLIYLIIIPILGVGLYAIISRVHPIFKQVFKIYDKLNRVVQENLRGVRVVKAFVREDYETKKFKEVSNDICQKTSFAEKILAFNAPLMQFSTYACIIILSWVGAKLVVSTHSTALTTGQLQSLFSYTTQILMSLMMLSMIFVMIIMSRASAERIVEVLDEKSNLTDDDAPVFDVKNGEIEFENVNFGYKNNLCLTDINLKIPSGATVGIIGGTGSGKSTLVQLIPRLYDVNSGSVKVGGKDVRSYDIEALRNSVAMVLQKNVLFSGTIKDNLRWGDKNATDEDIVRVCRLACADEFISSFPEKYDTYIEQGGSNVSGGQKQRLCIARALLKKPKILILDDSTSAVDTKTDSLIRKAFAEEIPDTTKLIIAQRISSVQNADMIVVLDGGKINAIGTHDELLESNEIYKEVYYSQQKGDDTNAGSDE